MSVTLASLQRTFRLRTTPTLDRQLVSDSDFDYTLFCGQMAPKFQPPLKRKPEPDDQIVGQCHDRKTKKKKKTKSDANKGVETVTKSTKTDEVVTKQRANPSKNEYVFSVANGQQSSVKVKRVLKMSKKFGIVDGKGLEDIEYEEQLVPQVKAVDDKVCLLSSALALLTFTGHHLVVRLRRMSQFPRPWLRSITLSTTSCGKTSKMTTTSSTRTDFGIESWLWKRFVFFCFV